MFNGYVGAFLAKLQELPKRNIVFGAVAFLVAVYLLGTLMRTSAVFLGGVVVGVVGMKCVGALVSGKGKFLSKIDDE